MTEAQKVAQTNKWPESFACGYLDGKRDRRASRVISNGTFGLFPQGKQDDYSLGYYRGAAEQPQ